MKRPQTKFYADTMNHSKVIRSKKSQNFSLGQNLSSGQNFLAAQRLFFIDILLKLQKQILICFGNFSCNSNIINGFVVTCDVIMLFYPLLD